MTHVGTVTGGPADPTLNRVGQLLDSPSVYRQDWAVRFEGLQEGIYCLDLGVQLFGAGPVTKSFPVEIPKYLYEGVVNILHPADSAIVDDRHFLAHGQMVGVSVLNHVQLRNLAGSLGLTITYPAIGMWVARWVGVPASHQNAPVTLAAKPPGGPEIVRTITIQRLAARNA
jgi:hypothetical protein